MAKADVKDIEKWWDASSPYFQKEAKFSTDTANYGPFSPLENKLKLLGNVKGKKILEIGCGGGQCSISFAKQGAICTGIDNSSKQLEFAKKLVAKEKVKVKLIKGDIQDLSKIKSGSQDIVFSAMALHYVPDLSKTFKEANRVLKSKGTFVFSHAQPFLETLNRKTKKVETSYFKTGKFEELETWPDGSKHKFVEFRRKISDIVNTLIESGFVLEKMLEPLDMSNVFPSEAFPKDLVKLTGATIIFKARKP